MLGTNLKKFPDTDTVRYRENKNGKDEQTSKKHNASSHS